MTETEHAAAITEKIAELAGPNFDFPPSADADMHACFLRRTDPAAAAALLWADWAADAEEQS